MAIFSSKEVTGLFEIVEASYTRNTEEKIGLKTVTEGTVRQRVEDYYIAKDDGSITGDSMSSIVNAFILEIEAIDSSSSSAELQISSAINTHGPRMFQRGVSLAKSSLMEFSDRALYWARIKSVVTLKQHEFLLSNATKSKELVKLLEIKTRGLDITSFDTANKKIIVTGFDPYQLWYSGGAKEHTSNPSGTLALALHGEILTDLGGTTASILTAVFPVRYQDFNEAIVEDYATPFLTSGNVNMFMTVSQNGGLTSFDIERFASRRRGGGQDNLRDSQSGPLIFPGSVPKEFYVTNLPIEFMLTFPELVGLPNQKVFYDQSFAAFNTNIEKSVYEKTPYNTFPRSLSSPFQKYSSVEEPINANVDSFVFDDSNLRSIEGSGGTYLSNEIFYRVARLREVLSSSTRTGHFHIPGTTDFSTRKIDDLQGIIDQTISTIKRTFAGV